jgi:uncharacterized protein with ATP-grasp and redox domains
MEIGFDAYASRYDAARAWTLSLRSHPEDVGRAAAAAAGALKDRGCLWAAAVAGEAFKAQDWGAFLAALSLPQFPGALRGADGGFTQASLITRLPMILEETLSSSRAPLSLVAAVRDLLITPLSQGLLLHAPENDSEGLWRPGADDSPRDWFWQEVSCYEHLKRMYAEHGIVTDPFAEQKAQALKAAEASFVATVGPRADDSPDLHYALSLSLWGNRGDLSLSGGKVLASAAEAGNVSDAGALLIDDRNEAAEALNQPNSNVAIILDNVGSELLADLFLSDTLLRGGVKSVTLHAKASPTFVSDATVTDVWAHVGWLESRIPSLSRRLRSFADAGLFNVTTHPFWTTARAGWEMTDDLRLLLSSATLAIFKGDANYRRLLGDRHWPHETSFYLVVGSYAPCPILALRTCKAGVVVGVSPELEQRARKTPFGGGDDWLVTGYFGLMQFADCRVRNI